MHGIPKIKSDEFQKELEKKKKEKKLALYVTARDIILHKMKTNEYDVEGLKVSANILAKNPDVYTFWNYRKRTLMRLKIATESNKHIAEDEIREVDQASLAKIFSGEMELTETCLHENPKSYGAWHHRQWTLGVWGVENVVVQSEIKKCLQLLSLDERNFHCWDYWRALCRMAHMDSKQQLEYCDSKIQANFSNYSAWHYRSTLLMQLQSGNNDEVQCYKRLERSTLEREFDLVHNAMFTDPEDQSVFFYRNWLMDSFDIKTPEISVNKVHLSLASSLPRLTLYFERPVNVKKNEISLISAGETPVLQGSDLNFAAVDKSRYSDTWFCDNEFWYSIRDSKTFSLNLKGKFVGNLIVQDGSSADDLHKKDSIEWNIVNDEQQKSENQANLSASGDAAWFNNCLRKDADNLRQLIRLAPNQKWPLMSLLCTLRQLNDEQYADEISDGLSQLKALDPSRLNYYNFLMSSMKR